MEKLSLSGFSSGSLRIRSSLWIQKTMKTRIPSNRFLTIHNFISMNKITFSFIELSKFELYSIKKIYSII